MFALRAMITLLKGHCCVAEPDRRVEKPAEGGAQEVPECEGGRPHAGDHGVLKITIEFRLIS